MDSAILDLPIERKIGQLFFVGVPGEILEGATRELIENIQPGGVCLFARNTKDAEKVRRLLDDLRDALPLDPFLSLDQEGGLVDRLRRITEPLPSAREIYESRNIDNVAELARITARVVRVLGFNMNFAPVVDVTTDERSKFIMANQKRTFGQNAEEAFQWSDRYLESLQSGGIIGCIKHFPGIGAVEFDPHEELPTVRLTTEELEQTDFLPFRNHLETGRIHAIMTGHITFPETDLQETDPDGKLLPASLSPRILTGLLREEFGFSGLTITDDLEMGAIVNNYGIGEASKMAFKAGSDFLLICNDPESVMKGYKAMCEGFKAGEITEEQIDRSLKRIDLARGMLRPPLNFDIEELDVLSDQIIRLKKQL